MQTQQPFSPEAEPVIKAPEAAPVPVLTEVPKAAGTEVPPNQAAKTAEVGVQPNPINEIIPSQPLTEERADVPVEDRGYVLNVEGLIEKHTGDPYQLTEAAEEASRRFLKEQFGKEIKK